MDSVFKKGSILYKHESHYFTLIGQASNAKLEKYFTTNWYH